MPTVIHTATPAALQPQQPLDMLVVAPHPDDAELGLGGTIAKMIDGGWRVGVLDLTSGEPTPHGSETIRRQETIAATEILGLTWRGNAGLPNRRLQPTLEARELLASYFRVLRPRWIFAPHWLDSHPDHLAATELIEAARFWAKLSYTEMPGDRFHPERIYYYFCVHLRLAIQPDLIVEITDQWDRKLESIQAYRSQFLVDQATDRPGVIDRISDAAAYWGGLIGRRFGEPIATKEPLALSSLRDLL